jgi:6-phosphogluconolactonase
VPSFDLVLLNMSADGSIASLFPDTYGFYESQRLVWVSRFIGAGLTQITMTHPLLHAASHIVVSVSGLESGLTLRDVFATEPDPIRYPVHALWPVLDRMTWLIDERAATFLPHRSYREGLNLKTATDRGRRSRRTA